MSSTRSRPSTAFWARAWQSLPRKQVPKRERDLHTTHATEVSMSTPQSNERTTQVPSAAVVDMKLEVVVIPVSDVDRAKRFYVGLGWRLDADLGSRRVQLTPPGPGRSVQSGEGP